MLLALRHWKAILGGLVLAGLLVLIHVRTNQRDAARELAEDTQAAFDKTVADYRAKAELARRQDAENVVRVQAEQAAITQEVSHDYQADLAAARARADALRVRLEQASANSGAGRTASVPTTSEAAGRSDGRAETSGFSLADRLIATEQAIQLDALQRWVRGQAAIDVNPSAQQPSEPVQP